MAMFGLLLFLILLLLFFAAHRAMMEYFEYMIKYDREPPKKSKKKLYK